MKQQWHALSGRETVGILHSSKNGLTDQESKKRLQKDGLNILPKETPISWWKILLQQFLSPLILILLFAAILSIVLSELVDFYVILGAVILNTTIGFVQEYKANRGLEALQNMVQSRACVLREGKRIEILASEIVFGDILLLATGDRILADARLLEVVDVQVDESSLTGESFPIKKSVEELLPETVLADRKNMVFAGTSVIAGHATAVVVAIGKKTEFGKIADLLIKTKEIQTPLQVELARLARWIAVIVIVLIVGLFGVGIFVGKSVFEMFEMSAALAVAAIPEGLLVSVTIILAIGMQRILKRGSLTRHMIAAETLGSVSVICSDKTGTMTEGEMQVVSIHTLEDRFQVNHIKESEHATFRKLFDAMVLCNDANSIYSNDLKEKHIVGNPTDRALLNASNVLGLDVETIRSNAERIGEIPFDSIRKYMVTRHTWDHSSRLFVKGAPENILPFFSYVYIGKKMEHFEPHHKKQFDKIVQDLTKEGLRLIAIGMKDTTKDHTTIDNNDLHGFVFLGFLGLKDPLRKESKMQILAAQNAGIRTVMITGDHPETARQIGEEAGLATHANQVVVGEELDTWSEEELLSRIGQINIFARVEPRHKIRIVSAFQSLGEVVAMTGDGVNDAPALKVADIGVALGSGTEVAKQTADIVLIDNNLGTITSAVEEGRIIFNNIRKVSVYLLGGSFTEIILIGGSLLLGLPLALLPAQILWINLVADSFPSIGLTFEPGEKDIMLLPPRKRTEPVLNRSIFSLTVWIGLLTGGILFGTFVLLNRSGLDITYVRSVLFAMVGVDTLIYVFALKSFRHPFFLARPFANPILLLCIGIGFLLMFIPFGIPFFHQIFVIQYLSLSDWGFVVMIGFVKLILIEFGKIFIFKSSHVTS